MLLNSKRAMRTAMIIGILCAVGMSGVGLMIGLWTGRESKVPISFSLFWILPALALPIFLLKLWWRRMPTLVFWMFFTGKVASLGWFNWAGCAHTRCTTSNPFIIGLTGFAYPPIWGWVVLAFISMLLRAGKQAAHRLQSIS
jgi:hypothetical protein